MSISVGDSIPSATLSKLDADKLIPISTDELFSQRKVVLFAVTGAFTPDCSDDHLPSFIRNADRLKQQGIDKIVCISVNDPYVMDIWSKTKDPEGKLLMLADANGDLTTKMGMDADVSNLGLGKRSQRYAAIVEDGVIKSLDVDEMGEVKVSKADKILEKLAT
jgi:glutaredoxin/glutathione-dependent peroxiredoxin